MSNQKQIKDIAENLREFAREQLSGCTNNTINAITIQSVATAIAYAIPLPTSPIDDTTPEDYYNSYHRWAVMKLVESLNEEFLVDTSAITRVAVQLWLLRYRIVYTPESIVGIIHAMATADGVYPEFVQEGLAEFHKSVGSTTTAQARYIEASTSICRNVNSYLNDKGE